MNFKLILFALLTTTHAQTTQCPSGIRIRQDIRDLSQKDRTAFVTAYVNLQNSGKLTRLQQMHPTYFEKIHHSPQFLPFHRAYLVDLEVLLQTQLGSQFTLPYWDWSMDSQTPEKSIIFTDNYVGANSPSTGGNIIDSPLVNMALSLPFPHNLTRGYNITIPPFVHYQILQESYITSNKSFSKFSSDLESIPHGTVHSNIGAVTGDMYTMLSVNDILFWLHHAFIDKLWADWQLMDQNVLLYDGKTYEDDYHYPPGTNSNATLTGYPNTTIKDVLAVSGMCYGYIEPSQYAYSLATDFGLVKIVPPAALSPGFVMHMGTNLTVLAEQQIAVNQTTVAINLAVANGAVLQKATSSDGQKPTTQNVLSGGENFTTHAIVIVIVLVISALSFQ